MFIDKSTYFPPLYIFHIPLINAWKYTGLSMIIYLEKSIIYDF